jgi:polar amino acid transport system permease protein
MIIREFGIVLEHADKLLNGLANTVLLAGVGSLLALVSGALIAMALMARNLVLRVAMQALVDAMRCVPFLMLAYIVYYGLPSIGINFGNFTAGLVALVLYNAAYMAEILRGAWSRLPPDYTQAAQAFGFHGFTMYRRIILPPIVMAAAPVIGNQVIQVIKDTAFLMIIAVPELTHAASSIQSTYYVPFAAFLSAIALYWVLCALVEWGVRGIERVAEGRR